MELDPGNEDAAYFIRPRLGDALGERGEFQENYAPEVYEEEELDIIEDYIAQTFRRV